MLICLAEEAKAIRTTRAIASSEGLGCLEGFVSGL